MCSKVGTVGLEYKSREMGPQSGTEEWELKSGGGEAEGQSIEWARRHRRD